MNGKKRKRIIIFAAAAAIILIIFLNLQSQREKSVAVDVKKVEREDLTSIITASGEVKPKKSVNISAQIPGRIIKIGVTEGQPVNAGDFLLKLDSTQYEANAARDRAGIRSFKAELIKAVAQMKRDERYYERQKQLYEKKLISRENLESAQAQHEISKAHHDAIVFQIEQAEASLQSSLDNLEKTVYTSPIDGIITALRIEEGEIALVGTMNNPGTVLMSIADLSVMEVEVEVDETDVVAVRIDQPAEVRVDAFPDIIIEGRVTEIGSSAIQKMTAAEESRDFKVVVTLMNPPGNLKPGLSASADIITAEKSGVLAVPISSLVLKEMTDEGDGAGEEQIEGVFVLKDSRAKFVPVEKGIMGELDIEILSGLEEGQEVVAGPYSALRILRDGMLLKPERR